jgi:hypothetical protein
VTGDEVDRAELGTRNDPDEGDEAIGDHDVGRDARVDGRPCGFAANRVVQSHLLGLLPVVVDDDGDCGVVGRVQAVQIGERCRDGPSRRVEHVCRRPLAVQLGVAGDKRVWVALESEALDPWFAARHRERSCGVLAARPPRALDEQLADGTAAVDSPLHDGYLPAR